MNPESIQEEESYIHEFLEYQERGKYLADCKDYLSVHEPYSVEYQEILGLLDDHYREEPTVLKVCGVLALTHIEMFLLDHDAFVPEEYFSNNYFQILGKTMKDWSFVELNPDGSCSDTIRQATKMLLHDFGAEYPGKIPFYDEAERPQA